MDCNCNQWSAGLSRPQMPPPPCMNTDCGCGSMPPMPPMPPIQPRMAEPSYSMTLDRRMSDRGMKSSCNMKPDKAAYMTDPINLPVAMAYVPWQQWRQTYPMDKAVVRGTIFPELDLPFVMGRCR